jgi:predicted RND superfamily exporter protein
VTTIVGFGALLLSHLGPVRALGFWCVVSTLEMLVFVFTVYPALLVVFPGKAGAGGESSTEVALQALGRRSAIWGIRHRRAVVACALLLGLAGLAGFPRLRVEGNALTYLPSDHPVRQGIERLEAAGVGSTSVELVIDRAPDSAAAGPGFADGEALAQLSFLAERLREVPGVIGVVGAGDLVDAALRRAGNASERAAGFGGGAALRGAALARLRAEPLGARALGRFLTADGASARLTLFTRTVGLDALQPVLLRAAALACEEFPEARVATTGEFPLLLDMQRGLIETLAASLGLALVAVAGVFLHLLRSLRYMPLAVVTSLLPVVIVIGGMGWCGVPLDIATVMIASIVLGLAGDDTIHTVDRFRELSRSCGPAEAVTSALAQNAPAYVLTALVRMAGFGVCALSGFIPIHRFGALSALAIALAAITDLVVVAALLGRPAADRVPGES